MIGTPAQWAAAGDTAAADALVERIPNPAVAVWTLLSLLAVADSDERAVTLLRRAGAAAASVVPAEPRAVTTIAVVRAAVTAGQAGVAGRIVSAAEPGLREHLTELLAAELARHDDSDRAQEIVDGLADPRRRERAFAAVTAERARRAGDPGVAVALAERVADPAARVSVLLAAGLVDQALAVPLSSGDVGGARTELAVALARRGNFEQAVEMIQRISGRRRRHLARRAAFASALPVPEAVRLTATFSDWERNWRVAGLATRAERLDDALAIVELTDRRIEALRRIAVATAERGAVTVAAGLVADLEPDTGTTLRLAEAVARDGDQDTAIAMITDPAICPPHSYESRPFHDHLAYVACAAAANGELVRALAAADTERGWYRANILRRAAFAAARHGHPRTALALAADFDSDRARRYLTATMLGVTAARGDLPGALALLDAHVPRSDQLRALGTIGRALIRAGRVPATGLLVWAEALNAERIATDDAAATLALAELAAVEGAIDHAVADTTRVGRSTDNPYLRGLLIDETLRSIACAAAAQGRIDEALALVEPCHSLVVAAAVGGQLTAAVGMATSIATDLAARPLSHSVAEHRRAILTDVCLALAAAGEVDRAVEAANFLPLRHRDAALWLIARTAARHGYLEAALHTWWLVGGPGQGGVADVAVTDVDAALAIAHTFHRGRDHALTTIAGVAAYRGLVPVAAAAVAGIEFSHSDLGSAWRHVAARFDEDQLRAAASAYLTARNHSSSQPGTPVTGGIRSAPGPAPAGFATTLVGNVVRISMLAAFGDTIDRDGLERLTAAIGGLDQHEIVGVLDWQTDTLRWNPHPAFAAVGVPAITVPRADITMIIRPGPHSSGRPPTYAVFIGEDEQELDFLLKNDLDLPEEASS